MVCVSVWCGLSVCERVYASEGLSISVRCVIAEIVDLRFFERY